LGSGHWKERKDMLRTEELGKKLGGDIFTYVERGEETKTGPISMGEKQGKGGNKGETWDVDLGQLTRGESTKIESNEKEHCDRRIVLLLCGGKPKKKEKRSPWRERLKKDTLHSSGKFLARRQKKGGA